MTNQHFNADLIAIAYKFHGSDREHLLSIAESGDGEKIKAAFYEAEEKLSGRCTNGRY